MKTAVNLTLFITLFFTYANAQNTKLDSLWEGKNVHDTTKTKDILDFGVKVMNKYMDSSLFYFNWAIAFADSSLIKSSLTEPTTRGLKLSKATSLRCIGVVHYYQGSFDKAIEFFHKSLTISEELDNKNGMSACYNNIGMIHSFQENYEQAIDYYNKSLKIEEERNNPKGMAATYTNIGIVYFHRGSKLNKKGEIKQARELFDNATKYYLQSLKIYEEMGEKRWISACYNNIGVVYKEQGIYDQALFYYVRSLKIKEEMGDKNGIVSSLINISALNNTLADSLAENQIQREQYLNSAIDYGQRALFLAREIKAKLRENEAAEALIYAYKRLGNTTKALEYAEVFISTKDSLFSEEKTKALTEMQTKYETEKRQQEIEKQKLIIEKREIDYSRQRIRLNFFIAGSILLGLLVLFVLRGYQQKNRSNIIISEKNALLEQVYEEVKATSEALSLQNERLKEQNDEITKQRNEIEIHRNSLANLAWELQDKSEEIEKQRNILSVQNKEITDSIVYAQRIQNAVLPTDEFLGKLFNDFFILYKPKSIVSGDFYWATRIKEQVIFCVTDCTGHGVPGAFMSMLGVSFLNEIVRKEEVTNAAQVLNELRGYVISSIIENDKNMVQFDGMDIGLCVFNTNSRVLQFAGANIPCWIYSQSHNSIEKTNGIEILNGIVELKPNRMPIGRFERMEPFSQIEYHLQFGDTIYLASDGYADQFGGAEGKKFQKLRLLETIQHVGSLSLLEQKKCLEDTFVEWKANRNQIDDVTVFAAMI